MCCLRAGDAAGNAPNRIVQFPEGIPSIVKKDNTMDGECKDGLTQHFPCSILDVSGCHAQKRIAQEWSSPAIAHALAPHIIRVEWKRGVAYEWQLEDGSVRRRMDGGFRAPVDLRLWCRVSRSCEPARCHRTRNRRSNAKWFFLVRHPRNKESRQRKRPRLR